MALPRGPVRWGRFPARIVTGSAAAPHRPPEAVTGSWCVKDASAVEGVPGRPPGVGSVSVPRIAVVNRLRWRAAGSDILLLDRDPYDPLTDAPLSALSGTCRGWQLAIMMACMWRSDEPRAALQS